MKKFWQWFYWWRNSTEWFPEVKKTAVSNATEVFDSRYRWVIARRFEDGVKDWYLRYCSTTGEPMWEDRLTINTERFRTARAAHVEMETYFIDGVFLSARPVRVDLEVDSFPSCGSTVRRVV